MNSSKASHQFTFKLPDSDVTLNDTFINEPHRSPIACERERESLQVFWTGDPRFSDGVETLVSFCSDFEVIHPGLVAAVATRMAGPALLA